MDRKSNKNRLKEGKEAVGVGDEKGGSGKEST